MTDIPNMESIGPVNSMGSTPLKSAWNITMQNQFRMEIMGNLTVYSNDAQFK